MKEEMRKEKGKKKTGDAAMGEMIAARKFDVVFEQFVKTKISKYQLIGGWRLERTNNCMHIACSLAVELGHS